MEGFRVKVLLDTHAVLWAAEADDRLGSDARKVLGGLNAGDAGISDITLLEIAMLESKKRIAISMPVQDYLRRLVRSFPTIPIDPATAAAACAVNLPQGDPFDRVIVGCALTHGIALITRDSNIRKSKIVPTIW